MVLNNRVMRIILALVFKILFLVTVGNLIRWLLVMFFVMMLHLSMGDSSSLIEGPQSSIGSKTMVLNHWVAWIILTLVLEIFFLITIGDLIGWLSVLVLYLRFLLRQSPESGISSESMILDNWITWVVLALVLKVLLLISVGNLIGWFLVMLSVMGSNEHVIVIELRKMSG